MKHELVYSALVTPDGTVLESLHRHDYKEHFDEKKRRTYMLDGGLDYIQRSDWGDERLISVYSTEPYEKVRDYAYRIERKKGSFVRVVLSALADDRLKHAFAFLDERLSEHDKELDTHYQLLKLEIAYRAKNTKCD